MTRTKDRCRIHCPYCDEAHEADDEIEQCPSPETIRAACQRIQSAWDERERARRLESAPDICPAAISRLLRHTKRVTPRVRLPFMAFEPKQITTHVS